MSDAPLPDQPPVDAVVARHNHLLAALEGDEWHRVAALLQTVTFEPGSPVTRGAGPLEGVYFPIEGLISLVTAAEDGAGVEVLSVGAEGCVGLVAALGASTIGFDTVASLRTVTLRMPVEAYRAEVERDGALARAVRAQTAMRIRALAITAACNARHSVAARCGRWLALAFDRVGGEMLPITHDTLARLLGVRRAGVTEALGELRAGGAIEYARGRIELKQRGALERAACSCYRDLSAVLHDQAPRPTG